MEIEVGREYNIKSINRRDDDDSYIFRAIVLENDRDDHYRIRITEFDVSRGQKPGDVIGATSDRFKSLVARTNKEAKYSLSKEY